MNSKVPVERPIQSRMTRGKLATSVGRSIWVVREPIANDPHDFQNSSIRIKCLQKEDALGVGQILSNIKVRDNIWHIKNVRHWLPIIDEWLSDKWSLCLVALDSKNKAIGIIRVKKWRHERRQHCAWIGPVAVCPGVWRQRVGMRLLETVAKICAESGVSRIEIAVPIDAKGMLELAHKAHFQIEGVQRRALRRSESYYTDLLMLARICK